MLRMSYSDVLEKLSIVISCQNDRLAVLEEAIKTLQHELASMAHAQEDQLARQASATTRGMMVVHDLIDQVETLRAAQQTQRDVSSHETVRSMDNELTELLARARRP